MERTNTGLPFLDINLIGKAPSKNKEGVELLNEVDKILSKPEVDIKNIKLTRHSKANKSDIDFSNAIAKTEKAIKLFKEAIKIDKKNEIFKSNLEVAYHLLYAIYNQEGVDILNYCQKEYENYFRSKAIMKELFNIGPSQQLNEEGRKMLFEATRVVIERNNQLFNEISAAIDKFKLALKGEPLNETFRKNKEIAEEILSQLTKPSNSKKSKFDFKKISINIFHYVVYGLVYCLILIMFYSGCDEFKLWYGKVLIGTCLIPYLLVAGDINWSISEFFKEPGVLGFIFIIVSVVFILWGAIQGLTTL